MFLFKNTDKAEEIIFSVETARMVYILSLVYSCLFRGTSLSKWQIAAITLMKFKDDTIMMM